MQPSVQTEFLLAWLKPLKHEQLKRLKKTKKPHNGRKPQEAISLLLINGANQLSFTQQVMIQKEIVWIEKRRLPRQALGAFQEKTSGSRTRTSGNASGLTGAAPVNRVDCR